MVIDENLNGVTNENVNDIKVKSKFDTSIELADNAMLKHRPDLFDEWNFEKNDELGLDIYKVTKSSGKKAWWICLKCDSNYDATIANRNVGKNCSYCSGRKVNHTNSLASLRPDLVKEWMYEKNYPNTPDNTLLNTHKRYWWKCWKCGSEYENSAENRVKASFPCPYCASKKVNHTNSLAALYPHLVEEWHPNKNGDLMPNMIVSQSHKRIWWRCKLGHEWDAVASTRTKMGCICPYCSGKKLLKGFNDMWTSNPDLASLLDNPEDGYTNMQRTIKKLDWKCKKCGSVVKNKSIDLVHSSGLACPNCTDGFSYAERFLFHILQSINMEFFSQNSFKWSKGKVYDFYLPSLNWIVEVHGIQHYEENGFHTMNRTFEEELTNDFLKEKMANDNNIANYIVIDARETSMSYLKKSILESDLGEFCSNIDFEDAGEKAERSIVVQAWEMWNSGVHSTLEIANVLKIDRHTATSYLKRGYAIGLCDYTPELGRRNKGGKPIVQLSLDGGFIQEWVSAREVGRVLECHSSGVTDACRGRLKTLKGYKWMYAKDYYEEVDIKND